MNWWILKITLRLITMKIIVSCSLNQTWSLISFQAADSPPCSSGLSGGPGRWMWADGRSVSFSRLRGAPQGRSDSDVGSDCVLVENPRSWISASCSPETQHTFICSSPAHTHWETLRVFTAAGHHDLRERVQIIFNDTQPCCSVH